MFTTGRREAHGATSIGDAAAAWPCEGAYGKKRLGNHRKQRGKHCEFMVIW
jgi:hypothetical protein